MWAPEFKRRNGSYEGKAGQGHGDVRIECTDLPQRGRSMPKSAIATLRATRSSVGARSPQRLQDGSLFRSSLKAAEQRDEALRERLMRGLGERHHVVFSLPKDPLFAAVLAGHVPY